MEIGGAVCPEGPFPSNVASPWAYAPPKGGYTVTVGGDGGTAAAPAPVEIVEIGRKADVAGGTNDTCVVFVMGVLLLAASHTSAAEDVDGSIPWLPKTPAMACSKTLAKLTGAFGGGA